MVRRIQAGTALLVFLLALLTGGLHPLGVLGDSTHACTGGDAHVAGDHAADPHHDPASCAACHLARHLAAPALPAAAPEPGPVAPTKVRPPRAVVPDRSASFSFSARAPPLA